MFGYSAKAALGQPLAMLLPAEQRAMHDTYIQRFATEPAVNRRMHERSEFVAQLDFPYEDKIVKFTVSIGCSMLNNDQESFADMLELADRALLEAKRNGRSRVLFRANS